MCDSLARGLWMRGKLAETNIPGEEWQRPVAAQWIGLQLLRFPCDAPQKLAEEYSQQMLDAAAEDDPEVAADLLVKFGEALEAYIKEHQAG